LSSFADQSSSINNHSTINISSPCSSSFVANISNRSGGGCSHFVGDNLLVNKGKGRKGREGKKFIFELIKKFI